MPWDLKGNRGINGATDFLGTTDDQPLVIKTNGVERALITADGGLTIKQDVIVGTMGIATVHTRHIDGKANGSNEPGDLWLNFGNRMTVFVGSPAANAGLYVNGTVTVTNDIILENADCAEEFTVTDPAATEPGTVMVLDEGGALRPCDQAHDRRVAGVVSGAGGYRPALVLDRRSEGTDRVPIAIVGKVYCKLDARYSPVETGDLLTTSPTSGHAMKATHPARAFGAVIGKALAGLAEGTGLIPILVALQ